MLQILINTIVVMFFEWFTRKILHKNRLKIHLNLINLYLFYYCVTRDSSYTCQFSTQKTNKEAKQTKVKSSLSSIKIYY